MNFRISDSEVRLCWNTKFLIAFGRHIVTTGSGTYIDITLNNIARYNESRKAPDKREREMEVPPIDYSVVVDSTVRNVQKPVLDQEVKSSFFPSTTGETPRLALHDYTKTSSCFASYDPPAVCAKNIFLDR